MEYAEFPTELVKRGLELITKKEDTCMQAVEHCISLTTPVSLIDQSLASRRLEVIKMDLSMSGLSRCSNTEVCFTKHKPSATLLSHDDKSHARRDVSKACQPSVPWRISPSPGL